MSFFDTKFFNQLITDNNVLRSFETAQSNLERLEILHVHFRNEPSFYESLQKIANEDTKNLERSLEAKNLGVQYFASKHCHAALMKTNESLSLAPPECEFLPHLFGNRSAICYDLRNYEDALVNIELALTHKMPELLKIKLLFRKAKCLQNLKDTEGENVYEDCIGRMSVLLACLKKDAPELKQCEDMKRKMQESWRDLKVKGSLAEIEDYKKTEVLTSGNFKHSEEIDNDQDFNPRLLSKNKHFPVASGKITLSETPQFGRGVFAVEDISPGQIVVLEEATVSVLRPSDQFRLTHCHHCLKRNPSRLVPCDRCDVLFCNEQCRNACDESTHDAECRVLPLIKQMPIFGIVEMVALRFVLLEIRQGTSVNDLCQKLSASENSSAVFATLAYQLETNENGRESTDMMTRVFKSLVLCQLLTTTNFFANTDTSNSIILNNYDSKNNNNNVHINELSSPLNPHTLQFGALLVHYFQVVACNAHDINTFFAAPPNGRVADSDQVQIGSGLYPFCSMFNHSCDPNVVRHSVHGSTVLVSSLKGIRKGAQLFDNYGCHYATMTKPQRQNYLWEQYRFRCGCHACLEDYPLYQPDRDEPMTFIEHYDNDRNTKNNIDNNNNTSIKIDCKTNTNKNKKNNRNTPPKSNNRHNTTNNNTTNTYNSSNDNNIGDPTPEHFVIKNTIQNSVHESIEVFNSILSGIVDHGHRATELGRKLTIVIRHLELLDRCVGRPHQEFEKAQETYKRILAYLTNCEALADGEEIPQ